MQYMLLIYGAPGSEPAYGTPEFAAMMKGFFDANAVMKADGVLRGGEGLKGVETATTLRIRGGHVDTMDGPCAEVREHLGGYYLIDVPDLDTALKYAALLPTAHFGCVEVRPLMDYDPMGQ